MLYLSVYQKIFKYKKAIKFFFSGSSAAFVNLFFLYLFHGVLKINVVFAASGAFALAYLYNFHLQKYWTYADYERSHIYGQMLKFFLIGVVGLVLNAVGIYYLVRIIGFWYILAQIILSLVLAIINFFLYKIVFRNKKDFSKNIKPKMKRLLIAAGIYPPDMGGPATYAAILKKRLAENGWELKVVCYGEEESGDQTQNIFRISRKQNVLARYFKYFLALWRQLEWADALYAQGPISEGLPSYFACRLRRKPFFIKIVGDYAWEQAVQRKGVKENLDDFQNKNYSLKTELWRFAQIFTTQGANKVVCPSAYLQSIVSGWGIEEEKIEIIHNSVKEAKVELDRETLRREMGLSGRIIVSACRLVPWKGLDVLIELAVKMKKDFSDFKFFIIGSGPDRDKLAESIKKNNLSETVKMLGVLKQDLLWRYIKAADIFILNTAYEGLSHLIIEAMSLGTPIITTRVGGNVEVIQDGYNGLLVEYNNQAELTAAISRIFKDRDFSKQLASEAKKSLNKYREETMLKKLFVVLADI